MLSKLMQNAWGYPCFGNILKKFRHSRINCSYRGYITGGSKEQGLQYDKTEEDEVEDLLRLLQEVKSK